MWPSSEIQLLHLFRLPFKSLVLQEFHFPQVNFSLLWAAAWQLVIWARLYYIELWGRREKCNNVVKFQEELRQAVSQCGLLRTVGLMHFQLGLGAIGL